MLDGALVHLIDDDEDVRRALAFLLGTAGLAVKVYGSAFSFLESYGIAVLYFQGPASAVLVNKKPQSRPEIAA